MSSAAPASRTPLFTCFTPTRNRAALLHRTYESLLAQTLQDFEWLVIDNCSTDATSELIAQWQKEATFPIRYIRRERNGGLASSYRIAFREAHGKFFLAMRDADRCVPTALERFMFHWFSIPEGLREGFVGVTANVVDEEGALVGDEFPAPVFDSDYAESTYRYKITGEKWGFQRIEVLRAHAEDVSPDYVGYMPESLIWRKIAMHYRTRYVNESLRVYYLNVANRQSTGATPWSNAYGTVLDAADALELDLKWLWVAPVRLAYQAMKYARVSFHLGRSPAEQFRRLKRPGARLLWLMLLVPGWFTYLRDDRRRAAMREPRPGDPGAIVQ